MASKNRNNSQIVAEINTPSTPNSGARPNLRKNSANNKDSLRKGPKAEKVVEKAEEKGPNKSYVEAHGNPKKRDAATFGINRESLKTASKLK